MYGEYGWYYKHHAMGDQSVFDDDRTLYGGIGGNGGKRKVDG